MNDVRNIAIDALDNLEYRQGVFDDVLRFLDTDTLVDIALFLMRIYVDDAELDFTIQDIARLYDNAINGIASYPMQRYVEGTAATLVHPHFNHYQTYLNDNWPHRHQKAIDKVPWLAYSEYQNSLVRVGWSINDGNTFGVKYE